jgi:hypothetical protein
MSEILLVKIRICELPMINSILTISSKIEENLKKMKGVSLPFFY